MLSLMALALAASRTPRR